MKYMDSLIDCQIRQWDSRKKTNIKNRSADLAFQHVITISIAPGARGDEIAQTLARVSGFHLFDQELIEDIAKDMGVQSKIIEILEESVQSELRAWIEGILRGRIIDSSDYLRPPARTPRAIARHGRAIIIDRGADIVLGPDGGFHARITGSQITRINRISDRK
jgi:hypothetical protein